MAVAGGAGTVGPGVEGCVAAGVGGKLELAGVVWPGVWLRVLVLVSRRGREVLSWLVCAAERLIIVWGDVLRPLVFGIDALVVLTLLRSSSSSPSESSEPYGVLGASCL